MIQLFEHDYCYAYFSIEWWVEGFYTMIVFYGDHRPYHAFPREFNNIINARMEGEELLNLIHARFGRRGH